VAVAVGGSGVLVNSEVGSWVAVAVGAGVVSVRTTTGVTAVPSGVLDSTDEGKPCAVGSPNVGVGGKNSSIVGVVMVASSSATLVAISASETGAFESPVRNRLQPESSRLARITITRIFFMLYLQFLEL
jgi:hypothetical protein